MSFKIQKSLQLVEVLDMMIEEDRWHVIAEPQDLPDWVEGFSKTAKKLDRGTGHSKYLSSVMGVQVFLRRMAMDWNGIVNPRIWVFMRNAPVIEDTRWKDSLRYIQCALEGLPCPVNYQMAFGKANAGITKEWLQHLRNYVQDGTPMPEVFAVSYNGSRHPTNLPRLH